MDKYAVIACPDCEYVRLVQQGHETTKCGRCGKQSKMKKLKRFVTTDSVEKARLVASELRAKQAGIEEDFYEAYENGEFDIENYEGVQGPADWLKQSDDDEDNRSDKQIVKDAIRDSEPATRENVIDTAVKDGMSEADIESMLDRLRQQTEILLSSDSTFRVL